MAIEVINDMHCFQKRIEKFRWGHKTAMEIAHFLYCRHLIAIHSCLYHQYILRSHGIGAQLNWSKTLKIEQQMSSNDLFI